MATSTSNSKFAAELLSFHSPDIDDLEGWQPDKPDDFGFMLEFDVGASSQPGTEHFATLVCTPTWFSRYYQSTDIVVGRHHLFMLSYNFERLSSFLSNAVSSCRGETFSEMADCVGRIGKSEFEEPPESLSG